MLGMGFMMTSFINAAIQIPWNEKSAQCIGMED